MSASLLEQRMTEADWTSQVIDYAHLRGWLVTHFRAARTAAGYRTAIQGDAGYPDLTMVREGQVIFAELKSERGRIGDAQKPWLAELAKAAVESPNVTVAVWKPGDWDLVKEALR